MTAPVPIVDSPQERSRNARRGEEAILKALNIWLALCLPILVSLLWMAPTDATAQVYRWVDKNGIAHYTVLRGEVRAHPPRHETAVEPVSVPAPSEVSEPATEDPKPLPEPPPAAKPEVAAERGPSDPLERVPPTPTPSPEPPPVSTPEVSASPGGIAELEARIARDKESLKDILSQGRPSGQDLASNPRLREIAERLPRLQSELSELRGELSP